MARTIIHIGMPRCGSTFFQREVFSKLIGFKFYGVETTFYSDAFQRLLYQDESEWNLEDARAFVDELPGPNRIFSNELFNGQTAFMNAGNRSRTARRLHDLFPDAEIMLFLRNQVSLLESLYSIAVYGGFSGTPQDFIKIPGLQINYHTYEPGEHLESFRYSALVNTYRSLFDKLHVLVFEDFTSNNTHFIQNLLQILQAEVDGDLALVKHNESLSRRQLYLFRMLNRWKPLINRGAFGSWLFGVKRRFIEHRIGGSKKFSLHAEMKETIQNYYREDNAELLKAAPEVNALGNFSDYYPLP